MNKTILTGLCALLVAAGAARAQGTAFTYQGRLTSGTNVANGSYDLTFALFSVSSGPGQVGAKLTNSAVAITNGLLTVALDFGPNFPGPDRWLEMGVRTNGSGAFTTLTPRQRITAAPYAITAGNLTGPVPDTALSANFPRLNSNNEFTGHIGLNDRDLRLRNAGDQNHGLGWYGTAGNNKPFAGVNVDGPALFGFSSGVLGTMATGQKIALLWNSAGSVGIGTNNPQSALHVAGTITATAVSGNGNQPLEFFVNGQRALRIVPTAQAPNMIGGSPFNFVSPGVIGGTIGGGGDVGFSNSVSGNYGTVGGGGRNTASGLATVSGGDNNTASGLYATVGGGLGSVASGSHATIGGGINNVANGVVPTVGGGGANTASSDFATVSGGFDNVANGEYATVPGGAHNTATNRAFAAGHRAKANQTGAFVWADSQNADFVSMASNQFLIRASGGVGIDTNNPQSALHVAGTVTATAVSGNGNQPFEFFVNGQRALRIVPTAEGPNMIGGSPFNFALPGVLGATLSGGGNFGNSNSVTSDYGTVGGGQRNTSANHAIVGGGFGNIASGQSSTVGGGAHNTASDAWATVGGGSNNKASGSSATVGGGGINEASGTSATVGGGQFNTASDHTATVGGGGANEATGESSTVGGGVANEASGDYATVPGGKLNTAAGDVSFAAGLKAKANHDGAFVWADYNFDNDFSSTANNQVSFRCTGGARFVTAIDGSGNPTAGVSLASGGTSWGTISDRNAKKNFQPVDGKAVLAKLAQLPVQRWNYKGEADDATPHLGPMAQDFKSAFFPGRDDKVITTLEFDGVELAAIQGLNQTLEEQRVENAELKQQLAELRQLVQSLARRLD